MSNIRTIKPSAEHLDWEISPVADQMHVTCIDRVTGHGGGGFATTPETAKKIALAELNERYLVAQIGNDSSLVRSWGMDEDRSCSGFAVGYARSKALVRSLCEAAERWALSRWIDDLQSLPSCDDYVRSSSSGKIKEFFTGVSTFSIEVPVVVDDFLLRPNVAVVLGWTADGVFAGYGSRLNRDEAIEHAYVEAMRNYLIFSNQLPKAEFPYDRITFFARNRERAESILASMNPYKPWLQPVVRLAKIERFDEMWLARFVLGNWTPWQHGPVDRFLY